MNYPQTYVIAMQRAAILREAARYLREEFTSASDVAAKKILVCAALPQNIAQVTSDNLIDLICELEALADSETDQANKFIVTEKEP
jgi:hypothetical protein